MPGCIAGEPRDGEVGASCRLRFVWGLWLGLVIFVGLELAHGWSVQFEPIGIVDDAIEDGVRERRLTDDIVPLVAGKLAGDKRRSVAVAVLDDLHQIAPLVGGGPGWSPIAGG